MLHKTVTYISYLGLDQLTSTSAIAGLISYRIPLVRGRAGQYTDQVGARRWAHQLRLKIRSRVHVTIESKVVNDVQTIPLPLEHCGPELDGS